MKTKGTFPGSFSVVDYKITSEYKMKLPEQPICIFYMTALPYGGQTIAKSRKFYPASRYNWQFDNYTYLEIRFG